MIHVFRFHRSLLQRHALTRHRFLPFSTCVVFRSWECVACAYTNQSTVSACTRCEVERDESAEALVTSKSMMQWKCACGALNGLLSCTCRQCGKEPQMQDELPEQSTETPDAFESQWICFCGAKNPSSRKDCAECAQSTTTMAESSRETAPAAAEKSRSSSADRTNDFWTCPCGAANRAYRSECAVCGESIEPEVQRNLLAACVEKEKETPSEPKPREFNQTPDWTCPSCAYANYGSRLECRQCGRSKVGQSLPQREVDLDWICAACSFSNFAKRTECYRCHWQKASKGLPGKTASDSPVVSKDFQQKRVFQTDWTCQSCSYVNFSARVECRRCGDRKASSPKETPAAPSDTAQPSLQNADRWPCICGEFNFIGTIRCSACLTKRPLIQGVPGDWVCLCGYLNYKYRQDCLRCSQPKKVMLFELEEGLSCLSWKCRECRSSTIHKPGVFRCNDCSAERPITNAMRNWICGNCKKSNNVDRLMCRSCGTKKSHIVDGVKRTVWKCDGCGNVNQHTHTACLNCTKKRSELQPPSETPVPPDEHVGATRKESLDTPPAAAPSDAQVERIIKRETPTAIDAAAGEWICTCGKPNANIHKKCEACEKTRFRVTVWYCSCCRTFSSCDVSVCGRCGVSRADSQAKQTKLSGWECRCGEKNEGADVACSKCGLIRNCPYGQQLAIRPGDWRCECDMVNKRPKRFCSHCRSPRRLLEWTCHCGTKNATSTVICVKCQSLPENGRWICDCGYSNFAGRMICHQCTKMRPTEDALSEMLRPEMKRHRVHTDKEVILKTPLVVESQSELRAECLSAQTESSSEVVQTAPKVSPRKSSQKAVQAEVSVESAETVAKAPPQKSSRKPKKLQKPTEVSGLTEEGGNVKPSKDKSVQAKKSVKKKSTRKTKKIVES
ncbi:hypothetical protein XU18_4671 [Perkinsela sp. CCAP 1560/4]|nr:hypothetical protein XU18_4671 [Perkinsela sp. CCAP 1560/4]|eukprot:KNH04001.1 hypothetical protein XU18_4671 [Perkinsela sp. CCAP 1560/4]